MNDPIRVLLIANLSDDVEVFRRALFNPAAPFEVSHVGCLDSALTALSTKKTDVVLLDIDLIDSHDRRPLSMLREHAPGVPVVVLSKTLDPERAAQLVQEGAQDCISRTAIDSGSLVRAVWYAVERSARQRAELSLLDSEALYHSLVENLPVCVLRKDLAGRFTFANRAYCEFTARDPQEILGKTDYDLSPFEIARKFHEDDQIVIETGRQIRFVEMNKTDDRTFWVEVIKTPVVDARGRIVGAQALFWDVTERQLAVEALKQAKEAAEAASVAKSQFLTNMSHEIRTPLNAVLGLTELVLKGSLTPTQREYLQLVRDSGESLLSVISDILDFSKIEAGKLSLETSPFDVRERVGDAVKSLALRAAEKKLELAVHVAQEVPDFIVGDPYRLRQLIVNLVGNAIKFTDEGEVVVDVGVDSVQESVVRMRFTVSDTGIGIPEDKLATIFQAFEQVDSSATRRFGGTGLGLAICYRLVELMGGHIGVESEPGRGSRFHFQVPFALSDQIAAADCRRASGRLSGKRVLIVDDHATNRRILEEMFRNWGLLPTSAAGVHEALGRLVAAKRGGTSFDLVVTDVHMPEMHGVDFVETMRVEPDFSDVAVILLSSVIDDSILDPARCRELRINACLTKPAKQSELFDAVVQALGIQLPEGGLVTSEDADLLGGIRTLRILLAEDNEVNRRLGVGLLESWGHQVSVARNGLEAVMAWRAEPFDLIVMDVQMPEMDGLQATRLIRDEEKQTGGHIPIIALTAHAMQGDREECLAAGTDDYVAKPLRVEKLLAAMSGITGLTRTNGHCPASMIAEATEYASPTPEAKAEPDENPNQNDCAAASVETGAVAGAEVRNPAVDWAQALDAVQGNRELLKEISEMFLLESAALRSQIRQAIDLGDLKAVRRDAHTLKGALYVFGNPTAIKLASQLECLGANGDQNAVRAAIRDLEAELQRLHDALQYSAP